VAAFALDRKLLAWDLQQNKSLGTWQVTTWDQECVAVSPDGKLVAVGTKEGVCHLVPMAGKRLSLPHPGHVNAVAFSSDGTRLVTGCGHASGPPGEFTDCRAIVWNVADGAEVKKLPLMPRPVTRVTFHKNDAEVVAYCDDQTLRRWNVETGVEHPKVHLANLETVRPIIEPALNLLACVEKDQKSPLLWSLGGADETRVTPTPERINSLAFAGNGRFLYCASQ